MTALPSIVSRARSVATRAGFEYSSDDAVGRLLSVLAAAVPRGGRILELGTGVGVGTAWVVDGLGERSDVEVITVESDEDIAKLAQGQAWPGCVKFVVDEAVHALPSLKTFDLLFADAQGGKWERLDLSIEALRQGGLLLVDDMKPQDWWTGEQTANQHRVRQTLLTDPSLVSCEVDLATGVLISARRSSPGAAL